MIRIINRSHGTNVVKKKYRLKKISATARNIQDRKKEYSIQRRQVEIPVATLMYSGVRAKFTSYDIKNSYFYTIRLGSYYSHLYAHFLVNKIHRGVQI